jgi:hypothetical protein
MQSVYATQTQHVTCRATAGTSRIHLSSALHSSVLDSTIRKTSWRRYALTLLSFSHNDW